MRGYFGGTQSDWVFTRYHFGDETLLALAKSAKLTFWSAQTGGTQYTDLLDSNGDPITQLAFNGHVMPRIQGPDGILSMWVDDGDSDRHLIYTVDLDAINAAVAAVEADRVAVQALLDTAIAGGGGNLYGIRGAATARVNPATGDPIPAGGMVVWLAATKPVNMIEPDGTAGTGDIWYNNPGA